MLKEEDLNMIINSESIVVLYKTTVEQVVSAAISFGVKEPMNVLS